MDLETVTMVLLQRQQQWSQNSSLKLDDNNNNDNTVAVCGCDKPHPCIWLTEVRKGDLLYDVEGYASCCRNVVHHKQRVTYSEFHMVACLTGDR